jgi:hypothetical protein
MIVDTERDGWTRVGKFDPSWRKSLRDKHWAQVSASPLGFSWTILRADPVTMCPVVVDDGEDISLSAAKDDVDHWNDHYHRHAVVVWRDPGNTGQWPWRYDCRYCGGRAGMLSSFARAAEDAWRSHRECEAAWQRGER